MRNEEIENALKEFIGCETYQPTEADREKVDEYLSTFKKREKKVIEMRWGLLDGVPKTVEETAKEFGITRERVLLIESKVFGPAIYAIRRRKTIKAFFNDIDQ